MSAGARSFGKAPRKCLGAAFLVPDGGRLCVGEDYFRSEHHLRAEKVTHSLVLTGREGTLAALPLIVRAIEGTPYRDAMSPYGLPGARMDRADSLPPAAFDWSATGLVSIFVRDRIGEPRCFTGGTPRCEVCLVDPARPVHFRETHRRHIRRNARLGFASTCTQAAQASYEEQEGFKAVYRETMQRDRASARYFFSDAWFAEAFASPAAWLLTTRAPEGRIASAALAVHSDGLLHYYLGGTSNADLALSPAKSVIAAMCELAAQQGLALHLGGGVRPGDSLEHFKRGFANRTAWFHTHELVCDAALYARLSGGRSGREYFPAYRAPQPETVELH